MISHTFKSRSFLLWLPMGVSAISVCFSFVKINASTLSFVFSKRFGKSFHVRTHEIEVWLSCSSGSPVGSDDGATGVHRDERLLSQNSVYCTCVDPITYNSAWSTSWNETITKRKCLKPLRSPGRMGTRAGARPSWRQFVVCLGSKTIMFSNLRQSFGIAAVARHRDVFKWMLCHGWLSLYSWHCC